jgi:hypothetical protein
MRRSYLKVEYLDDAQQPMLSFLSLSLNTENVWNVLCQVPYIECHNVFFKLNTYYYFCKQIPTAALHCFESQYVTWICCSEVQGSILRRDHNHSETWQSIGTLWTIDQANSKISACPLTTLTINRYLSWRESNPQSHQARGPNPTS